MARPRKKASDLTTDEALRKLFPKPVRDQAKKEAKIADADNKLSGKSKEKKPRNPSSGKG
jgi:hypothetical protein